MPGPFGAIVSGLDTTLPVSDASMDVLRGALYDELKRHVTSTDFVQSATADVGTILIWDNFAVLHRATPTTYRDADDERRRIYRYSARDVGAG
jgi:alpha-ketoglutarate-dependent taurine dioxygenase